MRSRLIFFFILLLASLGVLAQNKSLTLSKPLFNPLNAEIDLANVHTESGKYKSKGMVVVEFSPEIEKEPNLKEFDCTIKLTISTEKTIPVASFEHDFILSYNSKGTYTAKAFLAIENSKKISVSYKSSTGFPSSLSFSKINVKLSLEGQVDNINVISKPLCQYTDLTTTSGNLKVEWQKVPHADSYEIEWTYVDNTALKANGFEGEEKPATSLSVGQNLFRNNSSRVAVSGTSFEIPMVYEKGYIIYRVRGLSYQVKNGISEANYGSWSEETEGKNFVSDYSNKFKWAGHDTKVNWQSTISFAEEGKTKASIGYADGTSRLRQQIVRNNSENKAIIGETIYDSEGRGAIQVLPVPVNSASLGLRKDFNKNSLGNPYTALDFDEDATGNTCISPTGAMGFQLNGSAISGASNYYSPKNVFSEGIGDGNIMNKSNIPDANGYPFTQTVFTPDNTGRVKAQTGVGYAFRLGQKKETRHIYSAPTQEELYRIFGNEVGNANHYQKNITIDPNNQASISYADMNGKTIATSLAGEPSGNKTDFGKPSDIVDEPFNAVLLEDGNERLVGNNSLDPDKEGKTFTYSIGVATTSRYKFSYEATPTKLTPANCMGNSAIADPRCYNCVLDISFDLREKPCDPNLLGTTMDGQTPSNLSLNSTNEFDYVPCSTSTFKSVAELNNTKSLTPGSYLLTKKIRINKGKLEEYEQDYLSKNCLDKIENFIDAEEGKIEWSDCGITCNTCTTKVASLKSSGEITTEQYDELIKECDQYCNDNYICESAYKGMLGDMSPHGQYAEVSYQINLSKPSEPKLKLENGIFSVEEPPQEKFADEVDGYFPKPSTETIYDPSKFLLSVFNDNNFLSGKPEWRDDNRRPTWRYPYYVKNGAVSRHYTYEDGSLVKIKVRQEPCVLGGTDMCYKPAISNGDIKYDEAGEFYWVYPEQLASIQEFVTIYWRPSLAKYLVSYHPEYIYHEFCILNSTSNAFDLQLQKFEDKNDNLNEIKNFFYPTSARPAQFIPNPLDFTAANSIYAQDPFFKQYENATLEKGGNYLLRMKSAMMAYQTIPESVNSNKSFSMWEFANYNVNCPGSTLSGNCALANTKCLSPDIDSFQEWKQFLAFYMSEKSKLVKEAAHAFAIPKGYYNGCIGNKKFQVSDDGFGTYISSYQFSPPIMRQRSVKKYPCSLVTSDYQHSIGRWKCSKLVYEADYGQPYFQSTNADQACNAGNYYAGGSVHYYSGKLPRYFAQETVSGLGNMEKNCVKTVAVNTGVTPNGTEATTEIPIECEEEKLELILAAQEEVERELYKDCKQCPITRNLSGFLSQIVKTPDNRVNNPNSSILFTQGLDQQLNCFPYGLPAFGSELEEAFTGEVPIAQNPKNIFWNSTLDPNSSVTLNASIKSDNVTKGTFTFVLRPNANNSYPFSFSEINEICCLEPLRVATEVAAPFTFTTGKNFRFKAKKLTVQETPLDASLGTKLTLPITQEIWVEAKFQEAFTPVSESTSKVFSLFPCNFKPKCTTAPQTKMLEPFLSGLAFQFDPYICSETKGSSYKKSDLGINIPVAAVDLKPSDGIANYNLLIRKLTGQDVLKIDPGTGEKEYLNTLPTNCEWKVTGITPPSPANGKLTKIEAIINCPFSPTIGSTPQFNNCELNLSLFTDDLISTDQIINLKNIRMDKDPLGLSMPPITVAGVTTQTTQNFLIDVLYKVNIPGDETVYESDGSTSGTKSCNKPKTKYKVATNAKGFTTCFVVGKCESIVE